MVILYEDDIMPVGQYRDMPIKDIISVDPTYIKRFNTGKHNHTGKLYSNIAIADITIQSINKYNYERGN